MSHLNLHILPKSNSFPGAFSQMDFHIFSRQQEAVQIVSDVFSPTGGASLSRARSNMCVQCARGRCQICSSESGEQNTGRQKRWQVTSSTRPLACWESSEPSPAPFTHGLRWTLDQRDKVCLTSGLTYSDICVDTCSGSRRCSENVRVTVHVSKGLWKVLLW